MTRPYEVTRTEELHIRAVFDPSDPDGFTYVRDGRTYRLSTVTVILSREPGAVWAWPVSTWSGDVRTFWRRIRKDGSLALDAPVRAMIPREMFPQVIAAIREEVGSPIR